MSTVITVDSDTVGSVPLAIPAPVQWGLLTRIAFRFCSIYFTLYIVTTQMLLSIIPLPVQQPLKEIAPLRHVVAWAGTILGVSGQSPGPTGSGDRRYDWVLTFCLLVIAATATVGWSLVDRGRRHYEALQKWFRLFLRLGLGGTLITYGIAKAIPMQMPYPALPRLLEPYGHFSMMGVLWSQIGASPAYEIFNGFVELTAGLLLFVPGLTLIGGLVSLVTTTHVFVLNMTYDVPVKLFSFHLLLMALLLIAPDCRRLMNVLVLNRKAEPSAEPPIVQHGVGRRVIHAGQIILGAFLVWNGWSGVTQFDKVSGRGAPKPPLYGIWNIESMTIDGQSRPLLISDNERWRRLAIYSFVGRTWLTFQRMDDGFSYNEAQIDTQSSSITLKKMGANPTSESQPAGRLRSRRCRLASCFSRAI